MHGRLGLSLRQRAASARAARRAAARQRDGVVGRGARRAPRRHSATLVRRDGAPALAAIVSPHLTNEEHFTLRQLLTGGLRIEQRRRRRRGRAARRLPDQGREGRQRARRPRPRACGRSGRREPRRDPRRHRSRHHPRALRLRHGPLDRSGAPTRPRCSDASRSLVIVAPNEHPMLALAHTSSFRD